VPRIRSAVSVNCRTALQTLVPSIFRCPTVFIRSSLTLMILLQANEEQGVGCRDFKETAAMFILDTDTCVYALKQDEHALQQLLSTPREEITVSVITEGELRTGAAKSSSAYVICGHFQSGAGVAEREQQADLVSARIYAMQSPGGLPRGTPIIVLGDLNSNASFPPLLRRSASTRRMCPTRNATRRRKRFSAQNRRHGSRSG
jgi:hypothetical protein